MTAPSIDLVAHGEALASALAKRASRVRIPLTNEEVDALAREISLVKAQEQLTRGVADKVATTLDAFRHAGAKLERVDDLDPDGPKWRATLLNGHSIKAATPLLALQYVTGVQSDRAQFARVLDRHGLAAEAR